MSYLFFLNFTEIKCKDPDKVGMASTQISTHSVGGVAHYNCPRGYTMGGNGTRICLQNGSWSGQAPACFGLCPLFLRKSFFIEIFFLIIIRCDFNVAVDCKHPQSIDNGRVIVVNGTTTYGGASEYHCLPQFERVGPFLRKCLDSGMWSGEEPRCEGEFHNYLSVEF